MKRRFSWCTVVALLVLLFVTTEGLRGQNTQNEDHKSPDGTSRGARRFNSKSLEETTTVSASLSSRVKSSRDRSSPSRAPSNVERATPRSAIDRTRLPDKSRVSSITETTNNSRRKSPARQNEEIAKTEPTFSRRSDRRYLPESNDRRKVRDNDKDVAFEAPRENSESQRTPDKGSASGDTEKLNNKGPSVFAATTEYSRSRTGRKIQTTYTSKQLKGQVPTSRKFTNRDSNAAEATTLEPRGNGARVKSGASKLPERSTRLSRSKVDIKENTSTIQRRQDLLTESESVRVDIPLAVGITENPVSAIEPPTEDLSENSAVSPSGQFARLMSRRSDVKESSRTSGRDGKVISERTRNRGSSNDAETTTTSGHRSGSRRGTSRFSDYVTTEPNEQVVSPTRSTNSRDRARNPEIKSRSSANEVRPRTRGRNVESSSRSSPTGASGRRSAGDRNAPERRSRLSDVRSKTGENRAQDQDTRGRSRNRSRMDTSTPLTYDATTIMAPDTTVLDESLILTTEAEPMITTIKSVTPTPTSAPSRVTTRTPSTTSPPEGSSRNRGRGRGGNSTGRNPPKEDFFNHGLGFRGRKVPKEAASSTTGDSGTPNTVAKNDSQSRGNPGWTLRRRPGYTNNAETTTTTTTAKTILPAVKDQTNEIIPANEQITSTEVITKIESSTSVVRRGPKKQQATDGSATTTGTTMKSIKRGNKTFDKAGGSIPGKSTESLESDNYPPEFKARISQLKTVSPKIPAPKSTSRTVPEEQLEQRVGQRSRTISKAFESDDLEAAASENGFSMDLTLLTNPLTSINGTEMRHVKKSTAALFAERSRMKLEIARRLVKPELNIEDNDLVATTATSHAATAEVSAVDESRKVAKITEATGVQAGRRGSIESTQGDEVTETSKLARSRKGSEDTAKVTTGAPTTRKGRIISERMVTSISVEESSRGVVEETTRPYEASNPSVITAATEEGSATTIDSARIRFPSSHGEKRSKEERSTANKRIKSLISRGRDAENQTFSATVKSKKTPRDFSRANKANLESTTIRPSTTAPKPKKSYNPVRANKQSTQQRKPKTSQEVITTVKSTLTNSVTKAGFRPRYTKRTKQKSLENEVEYQTTAVPRSSVPTSRYSRKKFEVSKVLDNELKKATVTDGTEKQTRKHEFRPRTATYRRHSEVPTTLIESSTKVDGTGVAITPRSQRYHATVKSSTTTTRSVPQEPLLNLQIANDTVQQTTGITDSSNGDSGSTNIFNPTRSLAFVAGNATLLEQLRSTVAPLLNSLGNRTPVFSGAYRNVNNGNSAPRITPNGSPPRFSARYKGAELFVRKPSVYQPTVPSITSSSTTPSTPVENFGLPPPIDVSSPGEPRFLTFYQALETASIRNEQGNSSSPNNQEQAGRVAQVDTNANVINGTGNSSNNDTTSPTVVITPSPQTPDTTVNTIQESTQTPRLPEEAASSVTPPVTTEALGLENPSTPEQLSTNTESIATGTDSISTTESVTTSTESILAAEQASTTTETSSTVEQVSTNANVETTTSLGVSDVQLFSRTFESFNLVTEVATTTVSQNLASSSAPLMSTTDGAPVTTSGFESTDQSDTLSFTSTTVAAQTLDSQSTTTAQNLETTAAQETATPPAIGMVPTTTQSSLNLVDTTVSGVTSNIESTENPETNTIQQSEVSTTQETIISTESPTTEAVSNNAIDAETTTIPPIATTFRNRFIDFAQDILSRLQSTITTTTVPSRDFTTTISPATEISNVIPDSVANNTLEILAQLRDTVTTTSSSLNDIIESTTTTGVVQQESRETTTPVATDQSSSTTSEETTTSNPVGSIATLLPTTDQPNSMVSVQETDSQDVINSIATTTQDTQTTSSTDSTAIVDDRQFETLLDVDTASRNAEIADITVEILGNSTDLPLEAVMNDESTTTTPRYTTTTNDTLLTELMSIAKTLFSEEINETQQLLTTPGVPNDTNAVGNVPTGLESSTEIESLENEVDRSASTVDVSGTTRVPETSSIIPPDVTTETMQSTTLAAVETTSESVESFTSSSDPIQNEIESDARPATTAASLETSTDQSDTSARSNFIENEVEVTQTSQTTSITLGPTFENLESSTLSSVTSIEPQTSISNTTPTGSEIGPALTTQPQTTTQSTDTTVASTANFELTTNTYDLLSSNMLATTEIQMPSGESTGTVTESTERTMILTNATTLTLESVTEPTDANRLPELTTVPVTIPESILSRVNISSSVSLQSTVSSVDDTTVVATTELTESITNDVENATNQTTESVTQSAPNAPAIEVLNNDLAGTTVTSINPMDIAEATTNQPTLTSVTEPTMDRASNPPITTEATNTSDETTTTNVPQTTPNLENETPTLIARFQDALSTTAQGTAGSGMIAQTTEINVPPTVTESSSSQTSVDSTTLTLTESSVIGTTMSSLVETTIATTTTTETATRTSTEQRLPDAGTSTSETTTTGAGVFTVTPMSVTVVPTGTTGADINENLISTEVSSDTSGTTTAPPESLNTISRMDNEEGTMIDATTSPGTVAPTTPGILSTTTDANTATTMPPAVSQQVVRITPSPVLPAMGRFGGNRMTPAPRFSSSSTTKAPLRDYLIYGIYPNKTIVRKRPEDNLIDARNVDSPYVIFGIFPDGKLVRKFPNGTIIPDPPRNPVEVVFSLSTTTTTNRPPPRPYYNQANQGTYNQYQAPVYYNNRRPVAELMSNVQSQGTVDLGLTGNAIVGPNGGGTDFAGPLGTPTIVPTVDKMSNVLLNTQMGTTPNVVSAIAGLLTPIASTGRPPTDSQGGRIVQDRERDEATRTKEAGGQRSSVYIGQDKFVNYWSNGAPNANPPVVSVRINSVANAANEGTLSSTGSVPSFENLLNNQSGDQVTAPPGFPWRDPLDQIFGITTPSPGITASVATNSLDDADNVSLQARPINPFVEVFTPVSSTIGIAQATSAPPVPSTTTTTTTTMTPTTITTTTTTTTAAPTTTTMAPTTTTTTTTTMAPTTTTTTAASTTASGPATTPTAANIASQSTTSQTATVTPFGMPRGLLTNTQTQNAFGTTFDDLAFLNSLVPNTQTTTPKTLTQVEQLLANKILSLALNNPGSTRAAKAVDVANGSPNSISNEVPTKSSQAPIIIDLFPSSTATSPTWQTPSAQQQASQEPLENSLAPDRVTWKPVSTSTTSANAVPSTTAPTTAKTTLISTTKRPVAVTAKTVTTTRRPKTTTQAPIGFGASLWQTLFGGNLFGPSTTERPVRPAAKQVKTTPKPVDITPKPPQTTPKVPEVVQKAQVNLVSASTPKSVDISNIQVITPISVATNEKSVTTPNSISTTKPPLLNNPNPRLPNVVTSTYSPEEDAKFLAALLRAVQGDNTGSVSKKTSELTVDDESFLRAILSGQPVTSSTAAPATEISNAALLAALLKAQGIEPPTPANNVREQLLAASLGESVTSAPIASSAAGSSTTITTRPTSSATRPTVTTKKTVTPRPTSRPRPRTTTWSPSSTYPPPLFGSFANYGTPAQSPAGDNSGNGGLFGATRAFSQFLGAAITGAARQLQSFVRNGTRAVSDVVG